MPQTIALQRGSGSYTAGILTLFTQSGGTATRVIPVQLVIQNTGSMSGGVSSSNYAKLSLILQASGAGSSVLAAANSFQSALFFTTTLGWPIATNIQSLGGTATASNYYTYYAFQGPSNGGSFSSDGGVPYNPAPQNNNITPIPQFWMGPGDSVRLYINGNDSSGGSVSGSYSYSFVTITES